MEEVISLLPTGYRMKSRLNIGHVILLFALTALPFAATFALYYPDERHYTDGALRMLQHGNWAVPETAAGTPRFQKPPLAYWLVAASYATSGVGVLASRLPFLLASCGTLWLTYRLARRLTGRIETALLAAIVLSSHPQFFLCSIRSIPDSLQVLFITLSAYGFLRLIVFEEYATGAFWMAYGGAAGVVLSKGLLGAGIVLFAWTLAGWEKRDWRAAKKIIHWPSLATAIVLAVGWYGYVWEQQGAVALKVFFQDQVTGNLRGHWWSPIGHVPLYTLILIFNFLPWSATVVEWFVRKKSPATGRVPPLAQKFILAWTVFLIIGFAFGENVSLRYLLPTAPLLAVLLADWLPATESVHLIFSSRRILKIILVALALAAVAACYIDSQWPMPTILVVLVCGLFLFGLAALDSGVLWQNSLAAGEALGPAILLGWVLFFLATLPMLLPDRAQQIAAALQTTRTDSSPPVLLIGDVKLASRVRVLLGRNWTVTQADKLNPAVAADYTRILLPEKDVGEFANRGWITQAAAVGMGTPGGKELWEALKSGRLPEVLARHGQTIYLATHP